MTDKELLSIAREASGKAYVPYSKFAVGAALECRGGKVFTGCNVENAALGDTICAERTACVKAVSEGYRKFVRIAIYAESQNYCMPCGSCRQFLSEFNDGEMEGCAAVPTADTSAIASRSSSRTPSTSECSAHGRSALRLAVVVFAVARLYPA